MSLKNILKKLYFKIKFPTLNLGKNVNIGTNSFFEGENKIFSNTFFSGFLGFGSYIGENSNISGKIGRYCSIANNVSVIKGRHPTKKIVSTHPVFFSNKKVTLKPFLKENIFDEHIYADSNNRYSVIIGNDVWVGYGASILEGVKIGDGAIIAAHALVTKDVDPYCIVGGVPAKVIKKRFTDKQINILLGNKWWDKSVKWIEKNIEIFSDIDDFIEKIGGDKNI